MRKACSTILASVIASLLPAAVRAQAPSFVLKANIAVLLPPGVPRIHEFPRQPHGKQTTGVVSGARHVVRRDGNVYVYELAIPHSELATLKFASGTTLGLMVRRGNNDGPNVDYGTDKAVTKTSGLTLHPYWERKPSAGARWTLVR
jgi:hypothetical protein